MPYDEFFPASAAAWEKPTAKIHQLSRSFPHGFAPLVFPAARESSKQHSQAPNLPEAESSYEKLVQQRMFEPSLGTGVRVQGEKPFGRCREQRVGGKDLFLWKMHLLNGCLLLPYMSIHTRNLRNFHGSALRKSLHFSQTCLRWDIDCTRRSGSWGRLKMRDKNPEQQRCLEKAIRSLKHIQTTALEIRLKSLVTSGSLRRLLLFPSCKGLGMLLAAHV